MSSYGVPYKGSKNKIIDKLWEAIPTRGFDNFYDLFAGGCAVTHKAILSQVFKECFANDLDGQGLRLFQDSVSGKYHDERRWISRETFEALKDSDPYMACCWSFSNNQRSYLYSKEIESWKRALHYARVLGDNTLMRVFGINTDGSRKDIIAHHDEYKRKYIKWWLSKQEYTAEELDALVAKCNGDIAVQEEELRQYLLKGLESSGLTQAEVCRRLGNQMTSHYFGRSQWTFPTKENYRKMQTFMPALDKNYDEVVGLARLWQSLESLERLERLERLQSLEKLERLERLHATFKSYNEVEILPNSVIYCDPPYRGTNGYGNEFDYGQFYDWCERQNELVLISEYNMPDDRFVCVWGCQHRSRLSAIANNAVTERLFVPKCQAQRYYEMKQKPRYVELELF
jgi:site-specific DNA-adenine methylase